MSPPNKHRDFTHIPNPFITGTPVSDRKRFFGREEDFRFARDRLVAEKEGLVLLFKGDPRSGKTSILLQVLNGRLGEEFLPVFIDMQLPAGVSDDREFFAHMAERTCEYARDERIVTDQYDFSRGNPTIEFERLLDDIHTVFPDRRLIFLVDEAEILVKKVGNGELSGAVLMYMASILESRRVSFFFTGSMGLNERQDESWRRLAAKARERTIGLLNPTDAQRLITELVEGQVFYDEGVADAIYRLTFGHPFYTQFFCASAVDHLNRVRRNELSMADLDEIIQIFLNDPPGSMVDTWEGLARQEQIALSLLSEHGEDEPTYVRAETLADAIEEKKYPLPDISAEVLHIQMDKLYQREQRDMLDRNEEDAYAFCMDLFRRWIRRSRSIWQLVEEAPRKKSKKPLLAGILGAAAVVLAMIGFLWMRGPSKEDAPLPSTAITGSMVIESNPRDVEVLVNGRPQERRRTPIVIPNLVPGTYFVEVRHELYWPKTDSLRVIVGSIDTLRFDLQRKKGRLSVQSSPSGAQVVVRGEENPEGVTPLIGLELPTGKYAIEVSMAGHVTDRRPVTIVGDQPTDVRVDLIERPGDIYIVSDPPGAAILLNGKAHRERTPTELRLPAGRHNLALVLDQYQRADTTVSVELGRRDTVSCQLRLLPATLELSSNPPGAAIYIDGADAASGLTPDTLTFPSGRHSVRLVAEGYEVFEFGKDFLPDGTYTEHKNLERQHGWIRITNFFGTILIDETEEIEIPPGTIRLPVGEHTITAKGQRVTVHVVLKDTVRVSLP